MKQQDKEAERGVREEYLTRSFLPGALLSYTFKHLAILIYSSIFPQGHYTECWIFISYSAPMCEWHQHCSLFHKEKQLSEEITAFCKNNHHLDVLCGPFRLGASMLGPGLQAAFPQKKEHRVSGLQFHIKQGSLLNPNARRHLHVCHKFITDLEIRLKSLKT